jgi:hypothetical protein
MVSVEEVLTLSITSFGTEYAEVAARYREGRSVDCSEIVGFNRALSHWRTGYVCMREWMMFPPTRVVHSSEMARLGRTFSLARQECLHARKNDITADQDSVFRDDLVGF